MDTRKVIQKNLFAEQIRDTPIENKLLVFKG